MATTQATSSVLADNSVTSLKIAENAITARELATNAIVTLYIADNGVTSIKIAENNVTAREIAQNIITVAHLADDAVELAKMAANSVDSDQYVDLSIDSAHIANNAITAAKLPSAQTGITSILATDIKIGEDDQTKIDFETADTINFYAGNEKQLILTDGALTPGSNAIVDLGTDALEFKDAYFDGTVEADAITIGGTAIGSIYGVVAGSSSIVTTGAVNSGSITSGFGTIDTGSSNISTTGTLTGGPLVGSSLTMGSAAISEADIEQIDDLTAGTVVASKAVVVDGSKNVATLGTVGCGAITSTGSSSFATSVKTPLIEYTDGDDAMTIADGGGVTFGAGVSVTTNAAGTVTSDNDGSFALTASNDFTCTPSGNFTLTFTGIASSTKQSGNILLINSGGHTVSSHANTKNDSTFLATVTAAGTYLISYFCDGTNVYVANSAALS